MADRPISWILNPTRLGPDPGGVTWGLGVRDGVFRVYRAEVYAEAVTTDHETLGAAVDHLPRDIATFVRDYGADLVTWACVVDGERQNASRL